MGKKIDTVPAKGGTPKKKKEVATVKLVTFSMKAVIPVQQYGNLQPEITVTAPSIEEARAVVLPIIEDLYQHYAEATNDGRTPKFFKKPEVKVVEKVVTPPAPAQNSALTPAKEEPAGIATAIAKKEPVVEGDVPFVGTTHPDAPKTPGLIKGEGMVAGCMSRDALDVVEGQIKKSVKLSANEKDILLTLVLKKRKEF